MDDDVVNRTIIDVCTRSFLIISDEGEEKLVRCETPEQFMDVMEVVDRLLDPDRIIYAPISTEEKRKRKTRKRKS
tara:strand:+ start:439 stop:663 length:225 start_codon:yes stop_codon:yes gene_type:complete